MKKINSKKLIKNAILNSQFSELFLSLDVPIFLVEYQKGECIVSPYNDYHYFQVISDGTFSIYVIRNDGSRYGLSSGTKDYVLGELELFVSKDKSIFATAETKVTAITIDAKKYKNKLLGNIAFLRFISEILANKMNGITNLNAVPISLSERVLNYMTFKCENKTLSGIEKTASFLHCSARQLQRILNDFESKEKVKKIGKGSYRILE